MSQVVSMLQSSGIINYKVIHANITVLQICTYVIQEILCITTSIRAFLLPKYTNHKPQYLWCFNNTGAYIKVVLTAIATVSTK